MFYFESSRNKFLKSSLKSQRSVLNILIVWNALVLQVDARPKRTQIQKKTLTSVMIVGYNCGCHDSAGKAPVV